MRNVYNAVASLCSHVIGSCTEDFFVRYSCIADSERKRIREIVYSVMPVFFAGDAYSPIRQLEAGDLTEKFFDGLDALSERLKSESDYYSIVGLVQILDEGLETLLKEKILSLQQEKFSTILNTNRESTGIGLLPRCPCAWERSHRLVHSYNRMDNFLFNMLLMENSILGDLIDMHFFLPKDVFPRFPESKTLKIAATPLRLNGRFRSRPYCRDNIQYFNIEYTDSNFAESNELIWRKILKASDNECDIIVFPEMLGNPEMVDFVSDRIKAASDEQREKFPSMIILPSYWQNGYNAVTVLDRFGKVLCRQCKQNPFRMEVDGMGYLEGIVANKVVNIFHYEGVGRFAILICKDFLTTRYMEQLMRCFKLTLIIVPSFSTGSYDFRRSFDLCAHDDCNVVWINTCAALKKGKEANFENVGYVRKRISRLDDEAQMLCGMPICQGAFNGVCKQDCIYYETIQGV